MPDQDEARTVDDRKVPVEEKAWDSHVEAANATDPEFKHPRAEERANRGP